MNSRQQNIGIGLMLLVVAIIAALCAWRYDVVVDDGPPKPEPRIEENIPFTINGESGFYCDITISKNDQQVDTARAFCEGP